jgi:competence protein ComEC
MACRVLITGDVSTEVEATLQLPRCAVLQVGHHGSRTSTGDALLTAVAPELAVIPVGRDNTYGHPAAAPLQRLLDRAIDVLRTDLHGTVELTWHGDEITVRTHRYGEGWSSPAPARGR